ncbi:MAG: adenosylcobinamide-phosphate synthase CbiB [Methanoregulaceae archaeon]
MVLAWVVLPLSLLVDRALGDPQSGFHPVALLGRFIGWWGRPEQYPVWLQRAVGVFMWIVTAGLFALPFYLFGRFAPWLLVLVVAPFLLKVCLAWRALEEHALAVVSALSEGVGAGREKVALLVSRKTASLSSEEILSAGYESMTENLVDSIISPMAFFAVFGLAGAAVFRAANTMDAMLGYRDDRERIGWFPARMDDIMNYVPARVTVLLLLVYFGAKGRGQEAWRIMRRDGKNRPGFNGGIVMAAMAGGIGIQFRKPGVYRIGDGTRTLDGAGKEIIRAVRAATVIFAGIATSALFLLTMFAIV